MTKDAGADRAASAWHMKRQRVASLPWTLPAAGCCAKGPKTLTPRIPPMVITLIPTQMKPEPHDQSPSNTSSTPVVPMSVATAG